MVAPEGGASYASADDLGSRRQRESARQHGGSGVPQEMFGPYRLESLIGRGGMGEVYRALDTGQNRVVALKLLPEALSSDVDFRKRFSREAEAAAKLSEPHVVPIHRYGEIDGRLYLDMRLVVGQDLAATLTRDGALPASRAVAIVEQVAAALDAAHEAGLIHRDVKPSNVLLARSKPGRSEFAYLADFGIARAVNASTRSALTGTGNTIGTVDYMAPERFLGKAIDHRADVYSLACVLYECLTAARPYPTEEAVALLHAHLYLPPPRPSEARSQVPSAFDDVVARGMAKDPAERYASAGDLGAAAVAALSGTSVTAPAATGSAAPTRDVISASMPPRVPPTPPPILNRSMAETTIPPHPAAVDRPAPASRRSRRRTLLGAIITVMVVLAVVTVVLVIKGQPDTSFGLALPLAVDSSRCQLAADEPNADVVVTCTSTDPNGFSTAEFRRYSTEHALRTAFENYASDRRRLHFGDPARCGIEPNIRGISLVNGTETGDFACPGGEMAWTDTSMSAMGIVRRSDGNAQVLYDWWTRRNGAIYLSPGL